MCFRLSHLGIFRLFQALSFSALLFFPDITIITQGDQHNTVPIKMKALEKWHV